MSTVTLNVEITLKFSKKEWAEHYFVDAAEDEIIPITKQMIIDDFDANEWLGDELMTEMDGMQFDFNRYELTKLKVKGVKGARV